MDTPNVQMKMNTWNGTSWTEINSDLSTATYIDASAGTTVNASVVKMVVYTTPQV